MLLFFEEKQPCLLHGCPSFRSCKITRTDEVRQFFTTKFLIAMKRHFLSTICSLALLVFVGQNLSAQQETTAPASADKVIIIQKTQNEDGTWTVKKKSIEKGQNAEEFIKDADLDIDTDVENNSEIIIKTNGEGNDEKAETIMYIRKGGNKTEIKWDDSEGSNFSFDKLDKGQFALIGDENGEEKAFLGIYPETAEKGGVLVTDIVPGSGAAAAGLKSGDVITSIDGKTLTSQADLSTTLAAHKSGDAISVTFDREGQSMTTTATLTGKKTQRAYKYDIHFNHDYNYDYIVERDPCKVFIGVQIGGWSDGVKGVEVSGIITGWPAENAGLLAGDRIVSIDGITVNTNNELIVERDKHKPGEFFMIGYMRDGKLSSVKAQFKTCPGQEATEPVQETIVEQPTLPQIDNSLELEEMNAFPNPSYGDLNVHFKGEAVPTTVTITDINGKTVYSENLPNFDGVYDRLVDVSKGTPGTLLVSVRQGGKIITKPVVLLNRA